MAVYMRLKSNTGTLGIGYATSNGTLADYSGKAFVPCERMAEAKASRHHLCCAATWNEACC
jgi:hypothetical protein